MKVDEGIGDCGCEHFRTGEPAHRANIGSRRDVLHAPPSGYERSELDVNIHIDPGHPDSRIDMVHLRPPLAQADGRPIATLAQDRSCGGDSPESLTHVPRGTSGQDSSSADAPADARAQEAVAAHQREDAQVFLSHVPRGTFVRGPSRTVRRADALAWMAERMFEPADAPVLASDYQIASSQRDTLRRGNAWGSLRACETRDSLPESSNVRRSPALDQPANTATSAGPLDRDNHEADQRPARGNHQLPGTSR